MENNDELHPATIEDFNKITPEQWAEIHADLERCEREDEAMNLCPHNKGGELYIMHRYPIRVLYTRAGLQDFASSNHDAFLTETEIQEIGDTVMDDEGFQESLHIALQEAVEAVVDKRGKGRGDTPSNTTLSCILTGRA